MARASSVAHTSLAKLSAVPFAPVKLQPLSSRETVIGSFFDVSIVHFCHRVVIQGTFLTIK